MSISNVTSTFGQFPFQNFGTMSPWEVTELEREQEEKKKKFENQEFTYQNPIPENLKFKTPNVQTLKHLNLEKLEIETLNFQTQHN
ncbi:hypothetical protein G9A89_018827 [Geosiphon pyriformis]|nr:hypothetical protein G9A89_018827 [Geosiphon pyriformis]